MTNANTARVLSVASLAGLIGLITARVPSFGLERAEFSWVGFFAGLGAVLLAFVASRPVARAVNARPPGTPFQRKLLNVATLFFLAAIFVFTVYLYTGWLWAKVVLASTVLGGALSVFAGLVATWLGPQDEA